MRALVISGGGSKGAFAGGVAQYLIEELKRDYELYL
ncbi:MAG: patatin-like phospholipase family protein, partial [Salegentibacter mishustinae]|nr:patatin-like phospholipase family protein [Salegentibacter mishustinae]